MSIKWHSIESIPEGKMVLLCGPSGYTNVSHRIEVGYSDKEYRPLEPIRTYNNDAFTDGGERATHWAELPNFPEKSKEEEIQEILIALKKNLSGLSQKDIQNLRNTTYVNGKKLFNT